MQNLRGVAMEEKVMLYVVNSCKKKDKECTIEELFKSDFLKEKMNKLNKIKEINSYEFSYTNGSGTNKSRRKIL